MNRREITRQLHLQPFEIPQNVREDFARNAVAAKVLSLDAYEPTIGWSRQPTSPNGLLVSTLNGEDTIPHWIMMRTKIRRSFPSELLTVLPPKSTIPDLISLVRLGGSGICSFPNSLHGGITSTIFDEVFFATINHALNTHPEDEDNPQRFYTMQLNVKYRQAVKVPGLVVVRSWCIAMSGRKIWTYAELLQEDEFATMKADGTDADEEEDEMKGLRIAATCEAFWLLSPREKL